MRWYGEFMKEQEIPGLTPGDRSGALYSAGGGIRLFGCRAETSCLCKYPVAGRPCFPGLCGCGDYAAL